MNTELKNTDLNSNDAKPVLSESSLHDFLEYEVRSSWWVSWISWDWLQELSGRYFAWKTRRKYERYKMSKMWWEQRVKNFR